MDDSALALLRETFRTANSYAEWATLAVVIGLIVEFAVLLIFAKEISRTERWLLIFANILVAGGVGGEYVFGGRATTAAIQLQQASDEKVAMLGKDTAEAKKDAADAIERAAQLQKDSDKARLELAQIEATRTITPAQQVTLVQLLSNAAKGSISVVYPFADSTDAKTFADSISQTLERAGYTLAKPPPGYGGMIAFTAPGAFLAIHSLKAAPPVAVALQRAFAKIGIYLEGLPKDDIPEDGVVLVVSSHPYSVTPVPPPLVDAPIPDAAPSADAASPAPNATNPAAAITAPAAAKP